MSMLMRTRKIMGMCMRTCMSTCMHAEVPACTRGMCVCLARTFAARACALKVHVRVRVRVRATFMSTCHLVVVVHLLSHQSFRFHGDW